VSPRRTPPWLFLFATAGVAYALDRVTKLWAETTLAGRPPIVVIPHAVDLAYTTNSGGAFGLGQSAWWIFALASTAVSVAIVVSSFRVRRVLTGVSLGLILGGALGNLTDRVIHGDAFLRGHVVDFIDFHVWPVFNVADSSIVIGAILLAVFAARGEEA
jgi:signal peptidase II